jgi:hypothetical protein
MVPAYPGIGCIQVQGCGSDDVMYAHVQQGALYVQKGMVAQQHFEKTIKLPAAFELSQFLNFAKNDAQGSTTHGPVFPTDLVQR